MKLFKNMFRLFFLWTCMASGIAAGFLYSCESPQSSSQGLSDPGDSAWIAPDSVSELRNSFSDQKAIAGGESLYQIYCWSCHGETGMGDGAAGGAMGSKPANFHDDKVKSQSDGSIFWKISEGRGTMPPFKDVLSDEQRWQLVSFVRKLGRGSQTPYNRESPVALRPDIGIEHFLTIEPQAIRILYEPNTGFFGYSTYSGEVFKIISDDQGKINSEKIIDVEDHGIVRMQGASIRENSIFLTGNIRVNDNKGTMGKMVRVNLDPSGNHEVINFFTTEEYGTTNTPFDHGWSATEFSPDGKYIYVISGSRTDHGEIQDNLGAYPNSRDEPLTARLFRFPIDSRDLFLPNDIEELKSKGYVYAEGIRNAYDLAFDSDNNLFAVVNSGDYDQSEDMFWIREGHHYGFPWVMGGMETPQQYPDWHPDPEKDPFINTSSAAWPEGYYNDPGFAPRPIGVRFTPGIKNLGPDANKYRDRETGKVMDADTTGVAISTFTAHSSPLGFVFDKKRQLSNEYKGDGFTLRYTSGLKSSLMKPFTEKGEDLLHLDFSYDKSADNFTVKTYRIVEGFVQPIDAVLVENELYIIEYGGRQHGGNIWRVILPEGEQ
jgi:mono/diheme cytochrome c family protein